MAVQDEIPKSRLTLRYKTEIDGQPEDIKLPLRLFVNGDFSLGTSKDRKLDLDERRIRNMNGRNTDEVMKDMGIKLSCAVANKIDPSGEEDLQVNIPIDGMKSFSPGQIAKNIPKLNGLLKIKELMNEMLSSVDNRKELRKLLGELMSNEEALTKMLEEMKGFESFKLPTSGGK